METNDTSFTLSNGHALLTVDSFGGALLAFSLKNHPANPLGFRLDRKGQAPRGGFQGHFVCLGRWGDATEGERSNGLPKHGEACRLPWNTRIPPDGRSASMVVSCTGEQLDLQRQLDLWAQSPVVRVDETVTNRGALGRFYQLVQHPTLAAPFLDGDVRLFSNASLGFNQVFNAIPEAHALHWPYAHTEDGAMHRLNRFDEPYNGVFSFVVQPEDTYGWTVVYSRKSRLLIGYVWPRAQYPWINIWQDWHRGKPRYLGVEFGTTGLHKPFPAVVEERNARVFDAPTYAFIDANASQRFSYHVFLQRMAEPLHSVEYVAIGDDGLAMSLNGHERRLVGATG